MDAAELGIKGGGRWPLEQGVVWRLFFPAEGGARVCQALEGRERWETWQRSKEAAKEAEGAGQGLDGQVGTWRGGCGLMHGGFGGWKARECLRERQVGEAAPCPRSRDRLLPPPSPTPSTWDEDLSV